jgi:hypothetical protein
MDGAYRGQIGTVLSAGGGLVRVKIAGVDEPLLLPASSVELSTTAAPKVDCPPQP